MPSPVVTWRNFANNAAVTAWNIGTVDAGQSSSEFQVLIWNNRAGVSDVSDMQNVVMTTKDSTGGNTGDLVVDVWIQVKVNSLGESTFTAIGGTTTKAAGTTKSSEGPLTPGVAPHDSVTGSVDILGTANDGEKWTADTVGSRHGGGNYIDITLVAVVPSDAAAGTVNFKTRCAYQYI